MRLASSFLVSQTLKLSNRLFQPDLLRLIDLHDPAVLSLPPYAGRPHVRSRSSTAGIIFPISPWDIYGISILAISTAVNGFPHILILIFNADLMGASGQTMPREGAPTSR
jgi:hypothetical protein